MYLYCEAFLLVYVSVSNSGMKRRSGGLSTSVWSYDTISSNSIPLTMSHHPSQSDEAPFEIVKVGDNRELCVALAFVP